MSNSFVSSWSNRWKIVLGVLVTTATLSFLTPLPFIKTEYSTHGKHILQTLFSEIRNGENSLVGKNDSIPRTTVIDQENYFSRELNSNRIKKTQHTKSHLGSSKTPTMDRIKNRFNERQSLVKCAKDSFPRFYGCLDGNGLHNNYFNVCFIRKVASSYIHKLNKLFYNNGSMDLKPSVTIVIVRDPYSRMVSGYIDRVLTNPHRVTMFKSRDFRAFWPNATLRQSHELCHNAITFPQFVKFFLHFQKTGKRVDAHFRPMSYVCDPCKHKFDYIVHLETISEDMAYIFKTVHINNVTVPSSVEGSLISKPKKLTKFERVIRRCQTMCSAFKNAWWAFQARGYIPRDLEFPFRWPECDTMTGEDFGQVAWKTHVKYKDRFNRGLQKRQMMVELFLQIPLEDRLRIRELLSKDFYLFGYESTPMDIFPELA